MLETVIFDRATMQGARKEPWGGASAQLQVSILDTNGVEVPAGQRRVPGWASPDTAFGQRVLAKDEDPRTSKKKRMSSGEAPSRQHTGRSSDSNAEVGTGR